MGSTAQNGRTPAKTLLRFSYIQPSPCRAPLSGQAIGHHEDAPCRSSVYCRSRAVPRGSPGPPDSEGVELEDARKTSAQGVRRGKVGSLRDWGEVLSTQSRPPAQRARTP